MIVLCLAGTQRARVTDYGTSQDGGASDHVADHQDHPQLARMQLAMPSGHAAARNATLDVANSNPLEAFPASN